MANLPLAMDDLLLQMDYSASRGESEILYSSFNLWIQLFEVHEYTNCVQTPLHIAAANGHTQFMMNMMNMMNIIPTLATKLNGNGLSPLHVAILNCRLNTVRDLIRRYPKLVRVPGIDGKTPLHYIVEMDQSEPLFLDMLGIILLECPDSIWDVTNKLQNVFMLSLENGNERAFTMLLNWYLRSARKGALMLRDENGNTVLHVAVGKQLLQPVKQIVDLRLPIINHRNYDSETPLDMAMSKQLECTSTDAVWTSILIINALESGGGREGKKLAGHISTQDYLLSEPSRKELLMRSYLLMMGDLTFTMRGYISLVASLIMATTYLTVMMSPLDKFQEYMNVFLRMLTLTFTISTATVALMMPTSLPFMLLHIILSFFTSTYVMSVLSNSQANLVTQNICMLALGIIFVVQTVKFLYSQTLSREGNRSIVWWMIPHAWTQLLEEQSKIIISDSKALYN